MDDIQNLTGLIAAHKWLAVAAIVIGLLVRLVKEDRVVAWFPINIPSRWRPLLALGLGIISGVLQKASDGVTWPEAIIGGAVSAALAMSAHAVIVDSARNGRDLGVKKGHENDPPSKPPSIRPAEVGA